MHRSLVVLILIVILAGVSAGCTRPPVEDVEPTATHSPEPTAVVVEEDWWKTAIFYQIFVRSFEDSDGDGIGDFQGIINRLDYLNDGDPETSDDLGITAIWLMPIHPSPSYHGYDVTDYRQVNPDYGTMEDFSRLLEEAHRRGIRVIIDLVINHTSTQHPWFKEALNPDSPYHDYYVWADEDPGFRGPQSQKVWHFAPNGKYYYALFWDQMPDLNFLNEAVVGEVFDIARYWLEEVGVDGFRVDGAKHLIEEGSELENTEATHAWFQRFFSTYKDINPSAMTVGEVWSNSFSAVQYVKNSEMDMVFNFDLARSILNGVNSRNAGPLANTLSFETRLFPAGSMGIFLTNHDQDRTFSVLMNDRHKAKVAAAIYLTAPGIPFIYYGEEIGMTGTGDHLNIRTPMQWDSQRGAGFTTGPLWNYPNANYSENNVNQQLEDPDSLLRHYIRLIQARSQSPALTKGELVTVRSKHPGVLAYLRVDDQESVLILHNLSDSLVVGFSLTATGVLPPGQYRLEAVLDHRDGNTLAIDEQGGFTEFDPVITIDAGTSLIFRLQPLDSSP